MEDRFNLLFPAHSQRLHYLFEELLLSREREKYKNLCGEGT